jgi:hypothetical protein
MTNSLTREDEARMSDKQAQPNSMHALRSPALNRAARMGRRTETDPWRVLRIMGEFVEGFEEAEEQSYS